MEIEIRRPTPDEAISPLCGVKVFHFGDFLFSADELARCPYVRQETLDALHVTRRPMLSMARVRAMTREIARMFGQTTKTES